MSRAGTTVEPSSMPMTSTVVRAVMSRSVPVTTSWLPVSESRTPDDAPMSRVAPTRLAARQRLNEDVAL